ncbi:hypothetical protein ZIOFF_014049 [Zingiber officinale]|uniref:EF-hand domain-containing protein n=1 Tax=Zingiber officinale TaxID=94328 RepID=A0A8J5LDD7_ZINOF|nr:hypothetical protein ZIOFF_014049 [Zingiber officinale]
MLHYLLEFPFAFLFLRWIIAALGNNLSSFYSSSQKPSETLKRGGDIEGDLDRIGWEETEIVMGAIGLHERGSGRSAMEYHCSPEQLCGLFEEKEPSLEEVKEAFLVFDENGDGFIDAAELQSVLRRLGFAEGAELEECREMIRVYDANEDGKIGFSEFVGRSVAVDKVVDHQNTGGALADRQLAIDYLANHQLATA